MKDIKKYRGCICECTDSEDKYNTATLLEDYGVIVAEEVFNNIHTAHLPNLIVSSGLVKDYRELREDEVGFNSTSFINKLINCPDVTE